MSWMMKLYETYEDSIKNPELPDYPDPYFHVKEGCHLEITIDENGGFKSAKSLIIERTFGNKTEYKKLKTLIPVTPKSLTGRTSGAAPYPLAEKIQYLAGDYFDYGGTKKSYFDQYKKELEGWATHSQFGHWKTKAVLKYIEKESVVKNLLHAGLLYVFNEHGKNILITKWKEQCKTNEKKPPIIQAIGGEQGNAVIRWRVQKAGVPDDTTWNDEELIKSWQDYQAIVQKDNGFCQILGKEAFVTKTHPKAIYPQAVNSKLISTPTNKGYLTYLGRFTDESQPVGISFEVSQKSHNALRWLINRQGETFGNSQGKTKPSVIVCWAISGNSVPQPVIDTMSLLAIDFEESFDGPLEDNKETDQTIDLGYNFSTHLRKYMKGYKAKLENSKNIVILGLDSASDGRMSVTYYQELFPQQYIDQITRWHEDFAWYQRHKRDNLTVWPISTPTPKSIWEAVYGNTVSDSLKKNTIERILPCIIEARPFPNDLVEKAMHRASNRSIKRLSDQYSNSKSEKAAWEKHLGIACSLYRGFSKRNPNQTKEYGMALEEKNHSRDYLYGRLLAIAERIEEIALSVAGENRSTTSARLMQRFADRPASTWLNIELALQPYIQRLKNNRAGFLHNTQTLLDDVMSKFTSDSFSSDKPLSGEFLLAFHIQRLELRKKKHTNGNTEHDELQLEGDE